MAESTDKAATHPGEHPERHEHSDVDVRKLINAMAVIVAIAIAVHIILYFMYGAVQRREAMDPVNLPRSAVAPLPQVPPPDVPRLQSMPAPGFHTDTPRAEMAAMKSDNERLLHTYGPTTQPGVVRIPINRAMELALERGGLFPARAASTQPKGANDATR